MGVDYYKILQVDKNAKDDDLKKEVEAKFKQISVAYKVLSDPQKRAIYDQYGEEGLKRQVPSPGAPRVNSPRNANDVFAEFFGTGGDGAGPSVTSPKFFGTGGGGGSRAGSRFSGEMSAEDFFGPAFSGQKAAPIEKQLPCGLDDLYKGTTKKMKISREIACMSGKNITVEEILTIDLKPGWKKGTKITFPEKGNELPNVIAADIVFIIDEKPHDVFTRDGNDLIVTQKVSLAEALTGYTVHLTTLDGRRLTIPIDSIMLPGYEEVVPREGMPIPKDPSKRGDLRIKFNIKLPTRLTAEQKGGLKKLLAS